MSSLYEQYAQKMAANKAAMNATPTPEQVNNAMGVIPEGVQQLPNIETPTAPVSTPAAPSVPTEFTQPLRPAPVPVQETTTTQGTPEQLKALEASIGREQKAYTNQADYIKNLSSEQKKANLAADAELGSQEWKAQKYAEEVNTQKTALENDLKEMDSQIEKLKATEFKNFWADKSTMNKVGTALAVGLGQYASAMTGTQNLAWNMLQKAMDDDFRLQEANYNKQLRNIEMLKLGAEQKNKLIDAATKDFEIYKVARASYVEEKVNKALGEKPSPALQEILFKVQTAKEAASQSAMNNLMNKKVDQVVKAVPQLPIDHKQAMADVSNKESVISKYNKAIDDYNQIQDFKKSGNYNASVIKLIATGLEQGSYNPDNFDSTVRSAFEKVGDKWKLNVGRGNEQAIVKAAEKYFEENAKTSYKQAESILPMYQELSMRTSLQQGQKKPAFNLYTRTLPSDILNKSKDLSQSGLKKAQ